MFAYCMGKLSSILKHLYLLLFFLSTTSLCAQTFTVSGNIKDETNNPIPYTNILLLKAQDSTVVSGTTSNDDGKFIFNNIKADNYIIKASFISYEDNYSIINVTGDLKVPTLFLKESVESLSEIQITYKKPTLKREVDRLVFNVEKTALSEGNMMEVLRSTPGVIILNNKITVKNTTPTVYINDRKVHLSSQEIGDLLEGTNASNIKSIEVITNPPARYGAESGAVLNIIMTKNLVTGYSGSVFSNYTQGVFPKTNYGMTNYFKTSKVNLFANYSYNNRKINEENREIINYPDQEWRSDFDKNTWNETHNFSLNFDWDLNENNTLSISTNTQFLPYFKYLINNKTQITNNAIGRFNSQNLSRDNKNNLGFDFDYVHRFKGGAKLVLNSHYTTYDYSRSQDVNSDYFLVNNSFFQNNKYKTESNQDTEILTSQIDYSLPVGESGSFEAGAKYSNVKTSSAIVHNDIIGNTEVLNTANSDAFNYDETVYAGYLSFDKSWEKWSLSTGLRVEQTEIKAKSVSTSQDNDQEYLEWFPTANLGFQVSEKLNIYTNYKRSLQRPNYTSLNPFKIFLNDNTFVTGNPELKPIFINQIALGASINNKFTIDVHYSKSESNIFQIPFQDNVNNTLAYTYVNIKQREEIGFDVSANIDVTDKWFLYLGASFYNYKDIGNFFNSALELDKWSNYTVLSNDFSFLKDNSLTTNFTVTYIHKYIDGFQNVGTTIHSNLSFRKTILKGKGAISLSFSDLFNRQNYFTTTTILEPTSPFYQNNSLYQDIDDRYVKVGFRYKFGNTKLSTNERTLSVDERDRLTN